MVLVAIGATAAKFFGKDRDDAGDDVQGDDETTKVLFGAANRADYDKAPDLGSDDLVMYANGLRLGRSGDDKGPSVLIEALSYYDDHVEDSYWQLYDEVSGGGRRNRSIAIRFVASGGFNGKHKEVEFAGFLHVSDGKLSEIRFVTDLTVFNDMRRATGLALLQ